MQNSNAEIQNVNIQISKLNVKILSSKLKVKIQKFRFTNLQMVGFMIFFFPTTKFISFIILLRHSFAVVLFSIVYA